MNRMTLAALGAVAMLSGTSVFAQPVYNQSFETDTSGWTNSTGNTTTSSITRVASGTNGITSNTGNFHAIITNAENAYSDSGAAAPGYGSAGFTRFGFSSSQQPYPGNTFRQSVSVYINTLTAAPTVSPNDAAFWIDASPSRADGGGSNFGAEHNFRFYYTGDGASVGFDGGAERVAFTGDGWYDFEFLYTRSGADGAPSTTTLNVLRDGAVLGSNTFANADAPNSSLGGSGYLWFTLFQNGFSGNQLAIDDLTVAPGSGALAGAVPEPATWGMMLVGFGLVGAAARRRKGAASLTA